MFDLDGTLTALQYAQDSILPCADDELEEYHRENNMYEHARALDTMKYIISQLDSENMYILTKSVSTTVDKKNEYVTEQFPQVPVENIHHVFNVKNKLDVLKEIHAKTGNEIVFVEDNSDNLLLVEENLDYIRGFHVSSILP